LQALPAGSNNAVSFPTAAVTAVGITPGSNHSFSVTNSGVYLVNWTLNIFASTTGGTAALVFASETLGGMGQLFDIDIFTTPQMVSNSIIVNLNSGTPYALEVTNNAIVEISTASITFTEIAP
jgi:hypothetical protein